MATTQSLFHKTAAGHQACERVDSRLPQDYRTILETVRHATRFGEIEARLGHCPQAQIVRYLEDLEAIGLIESVPLEWLVDLYILGRHEPKPLGSTS